jgi:hypothetical protein
VQGQGETQSPLLGRTPPDLVVAQLASQRTLATARLSTVGFFIMTWATRDPERSFVDVY